MIVECFACTGAALPLSNRDPRRGYDTSTRFPVTVGREYHVFAVTVFLGSAWYYIMNDDGHEWPTWTPSALFNVTDGDLPNSWVVGYHRLSQEEQVPLISFPEWASDWGFYERLVDRDPEAVRIFNARRLEVKGDLETDG